jgi:hypothetical protein
LADILEFDLEIDCLPRARNYIQDTLSRRPDYKERPIPTNWTNNSSDSTDSILALELNNKDAWLSGSEMVIGMILTIRMSYRFCNMVLINSYLSMIREDFWQEQSFSSWNLMAY